MESILYMSGVSMMQNRYDLHHIASENGEQLCKNKVWREGIGVVKVGSIRIITYGPYIRKWELKIRKWE